MNKLCAVMAGLYVLAGAAPCMAGQLQYQPVNPNFGGNPLNGSFLIQQAQANNHFLTNPSTSSQASQAGTTQDFNTQVRNSLLSALESQAAQIAVNAILGANGQAQNQGTINLAGELIQFQRSGGQINLTLTDTTTGATTQISVPVPQF